MGEISIECRNLTKRFGGVAALEGLSADFEAGKITALVGPNGAGKTTLFHLIGGAMKPDAGEIRYRAQRIDGKAPWQIARLGIGRLFQDVRVFSRLSVLDNVRVGFPDESAWRALVLRRRVQRREALITEQARQLLDFIALGPFENTRAADLSFGQQKLLSLARLLASKADVLLMDEPTAGINPATAEVLLGALRRLAAEGRTVVVIEHNMTMVLDYCDWVLFMDNGRVAAFGLPDDVLGDSAIRAAYLGI